MKKLSIRFLLVAVIIAIGIAESNAEQVWIGDLYYTLNSDGTAEVTRPGDEGYDRIKGDVVIPETITYNEVTYKVITIGRDAFEYYGLTSVSIPNSVTTISSSAFSHNFKLKSVIIGNSVTEIKNHAFYDCPSLTSITIPNSVTVISSNAFTSCPGLTSVTLSNSLTEIDGYTFMNCTGLTSITLPESITRIGSHAFQGCTGLTSISIPNSVRYLAQGAFKGCTGLTSVTLSNSLTTLNGYTFKGCTGLTSVTIPNSVTRIETETFLGCSGLTTVTLGKNVEVIADQAFYSDNSKIELIKCLNPTPPDVFYLYLVFPKSILSTCVLQVPEEALETYRSQAYWKQFINIEALPADGGICDIGADDRIEVARYDVNGREVNADYTGIVIVRYNDGTVQKVVTK